MHNIEAITRQLFDELGKALPLLFRGQRNKEKVYREVMLPAAELANLMQGSATSYKLHMPTTILTRHKPAVMEDLKRYRVVEARSGKHVKPVSAVAADEHGVIGHYIINLEPALYRVNGNQEEVVLLLPMFLIELLHPLGKRNRSSA